MSIFPFFKKKDFFTIGEKDQVMAAIRAAEKITSAQIVLYIEHKNHLVDPVERAKEIFTQLKMKQTQQHNAVLIYIAIKHRELALYADQGVYDKVGKEFWENAVRNMIAHFQGGNIIQGIEDCIASIGQTLKEKFPYDASTGYNELPDDIVFGK